MQFDLMIKTITYDTSTGKAIAESIAPVGTASLEQVHAWLEKGDTRIWEPCSHAQAAASRG